MALPANILDGFCIYCPKNSLEDWVNDIHTVDEAHHIAQKVFVELCSGRRVRHLHQAPPIKRDIPFENICLYNWDALYLCQLKYAVKRGDVGTVLDITTHWMLMFRGMGKMPKYADTPFHLIMDLKMMDPRLW